VSAITTIHSRPVVQKLINSGVEFHWHLSHAMSNYLANAAVLGQNGRGQNGTDKMASIESAISQAIQLPLTI